MRVLVTGAHGFAGTWLRRELVRHGHTAIAAPARSELDIVEAESVQALVARSEPHAIVHLAAISFAPDAAREPELAIRVASEGTRAVLHAARAVSRRMRLLVVSSADVYARPISGAGVLDESSPVQPTRPYAEAKVAQEQAAFELARELDLEVVIARPFNHTGPGQRPPFVIPSLAQRVMDVRAGRSTSIAVGNLDVVRDFTDVRDVVRAYRLIIERWPDVGPGRARVLNVASGTGVSIREILSDMTAAAGVAPRIDVRPDLVRAGESPVIIGSAQQLRMATGWEPTIPIAVTLRDVLDDVVNSAPA